MANNRNRKLVPECAPALDQMKYEIAAELGIPFGQGAADFSSEFAGELGAIGSQSGGRAYLGHITTREAGTIGGNITRKLVQQGEQSTF